MSRPPEHPKPPPLDYASPPRFAEREDPEADADRESAVALGVVSLLLGLVPAGAAGYLWTQPVTPSFLGAIAAAMIWIAADVFGLVCAFLGWVFSRDEASIWGVRLALWGGLLDAAGLAGAYFYFSR